MTTGPSSPRPAQDWRRFPVIAGPTAGGKSALALALAHALGGRAEVVTADAFQVYRGMDIGTAKPTPAERASVPHHLLDLVEPAGPGPRFTVAQWLPLAERAIAEAAGRGNLPVVVGGTHLYVKALLEGLFEGPAPDPALRARLEAEPLPALRARLERVDPAAAGRIDPADRRRTVRALEVHEQTGRPISELQTQWDARGAAAERAARFERACGMAPVLVVIDWPVEELNRRINARVRTMVERGLVEEVRGLLAGGRLPPGSPGREGLGYKQLAECLETGGRLEEAVERVKIETRRLAKNQRTWLKRLRTTPGTVVLEGEASTSPGAVEAVLSACRGPGGG